MNEEYENSNPNVVIDTVYNICKLFPEFTSNGFTLASKPNCFYFILGNLKLLKAKKGDDPRSSVDCLELNAENDKLTLIRGLKIALSEPIKELYHKDFANKVLASRKKLELKSKGKDVWSLWLKVYDKWGFTKDCIEL